MTSGGGEDIIVSFYMKSAWEVGQQIWLQVSGIGLVGARTAIRKLAARPGCVVFSSGLHSK